MNPSAEFNATTGLTVDVDLDLLVYTPKEFEEQRDKGLIKRAIETGQVLYEKKSP
jgi:hypothetical protein